MPMAVGYARVSTQEQDLALQLDALQAAGCERIYTEKASGAQRDRPQLQAALDYMRPDDTPTVPSLLTPVSSRNALLLQSLPTNTPFWQVNSRRRKDDTCVGTAARGIVERLSRLPRCFP